MLPIFILFPQELNNAISVVTERKKTFLSEKDKDKDAIVSSDKLRVRERRLNLPIFLTFVSLCIYEQLTWANEHNLRVSDTVLFWKQITNEYKQFGQTRANNSGATRRLANVPPTYSANQNRFTYQVSVRRHLCLHVEENRVQLPKLSYRCHCSHSESKCSYRIHGLFSLLFLCIIIIIIVVVVVVIIIIIIMTKRIRMTTMVWWCRWWWWWRRLRRRWGWWCCWWWRWWWWWWWR